MIALLLLGVTALTASKHNRSKMAQSWIERLTILGLLLGGFGSLYIVDQALWPLASVLVFGAYTRLARERAPIFSAFQLGALGYGFCFAAVRTAPWLWNLLQSLSYSYSELLGIIFGSGIKYGPTFIGFWIFFSVVSLSGALYFSGDRGYRPLTILTVLYALALNAVLVGFGYRWMMRLSVIYKDHFLDNPKVKNWTSPYPDILAAAIPFCYFLALLLPSALLLTRIKLKPRLTAPVSIRLWPVALAIFSAGLISNLLPLRGQPSSPTITFDTGKLAGWEVPQIGAFGIQNAGMFGLAPKYLTAAGYKVNIMQDRDRDLAASLSKSSVFVIINPDWYYDANQKQEIWKFVKNGGSLLVLGDHTDLGGIMEPLNDLLAPYSIAYLFDSAFTSNHWLHDLEIFPHAVTGVVDASNERLQQSTGSSLAVSYPARPIISGKYVFSDLGDRNNTNAYLGDYYYQQTELLGDLPIVAEARKGRGRVVAFGDTTTLQNTASYHSGQFYLTLFNYLSRKGYYGLHALQPWLVLLLLGGACFLTMRVRESLNPLTISALVAVFLVGFTASSACSHWRLRLKPLNGPVAMVDATHVNLCYLAHWEEPSIGGLTLNFARNGFLAVVNRESPITKHLLTNVKFFTIIAPAAPYTKAEIAELHQYMQAGGIVILSVGYEEKAGAQTLLDSVNLDISDIPLGPVPVIQKTMDGEILAHLKRIPHFMEAWPIINKNNGPLEVLYRDEYNFPLVGFRRIGSGGIMLIADSRYLHDKTLEAEKEYWDGNIAFFRRLLLHHSQRGR